MLLSVVGKVSFSISELVEKSIEVLLKTIGNSINPKFKYLV